MCIVIATQGYKRYQSRYWLFQDWVEEGHIWRFPQTRVTEELREPCVALNISSGKHQANTVGNLGLEKPSSKSWSIRRRARGVIPLLPPMIGSYSAQCSAPENDEFAAQKNAQYRERCPWNIWFPTKTTRLVELLSPMWKLTLNWSHSPTWYRLWDTVPAKSFARLLTGL